jgi:hypothetical protein
METVLRVLTTIALGSAAAIAVELGWVSPAGATPVTTVYTVDPARSWWSRCGTAQFFGYLGPCVANPLPETPPSGFVFPPFSMSGSFSITTDSAAGTVSIADLGIIVAGYPGFVDPFPLATFPPIDLSTFTGTPTATGADLTPPASCDTYGAGNKTLQLRYAGGAAIIEGRHECWSDAGPVQIRVHGIAVPEPLAATLLAVGVTAMAFRGRRVAS